MRLINIHLLTAGRLLVWHSAELSSTVRCVCVWEFAAKLSALLFLQLTGVIKTRTPVMTRAEVRREGKALRKVSERQRRKHLTLMDSQHSVRSVKPKIWWCCCFCCVCHLDPNHWAAQFPKCGGLRQSPINIVTSKVHVDIALPPFDFIGHTNTINVTVENKGHSGNREILQTHRAACCFHKYNC